MTSLMNFRDVAASSGMAPLVQNDLLYRSGHMGHGLEATDRNFLIALDLARVVDLRFPEERRRQPSPWTGERLDRVTDLAEESRADAPHHRILAAGREGPEVIRSAYVSLYRAMPFDSALQPLFGRALKSMATNGGRTLIHCTAGKDRTGVLVGVVLSALRVPRATILDDYLLSAKSQRLKALKPDLVRSAETLHGYRLSDEVADALLGVEPTYLEAALDAIDDRCGTIDTYLDQVGVTADMRSDLCRFFGRGASG